MRMWIAGALLLGSATIFSTGCATSEEWAEWRGHSTHFASGDHGFFSLRNREGMPARVSRKNLEQARAEQWWGKVVMVSREQIIAD